MIIISKSDGGIKTKITSRKRSRYLQSFLLSIQLLFVIQSYAQTLTGTIPADSIVAEWYNQFTQYKFGRGLQNSINIDGNIRSQFFYIHNEDWGDKQPKDDGYILARFLARADLHLHRYFRSVIHLQSSLAKGREGAGPVDQNPLELHEWFVEIGKMERKSVKLKFGRQELSYGSQRLVAIRDGPNNRQSFDAIKIQVTTTRNDLQTFYSRPVMAKPGAFNDRHSKNSQFWGIYNVVNNLPVVSNVDLYYFGIIRKQSVFNDGVGREERHSAGIRIWKKSTSWNYDIETVFQVGTFSGKKIRAYTASANISYIFSNLITRPEIGIKTELISGDLEKGDTKLGTFNPMFPRGSYFGLAALIGPSNLVDVHPSAGLSLIKDLRFLVDLIAFRRYSRKDGMYASNVSLIYDDSRTDVTRIGYQLAAALYYTKLQHLSFRTEFTWFDAGRFLKVAGAGKDIIFTGVTAELNW